MQSSQGILLFLKWWAGAGGRGGSGQGASFAIACQGGVYMAHCIPKLMIANPKSRKHELKQMQHKEELEEKGCCVALSCQRSVQRILEANPASAESAQINLLCCQPGSVSRTSSA